MGEKTYRTMQLKNVNRVAVLNYIRRNNNTTRSNLASITGLTFMAIKKILEELEQMGLVRQDDLQVGEIGRKSATYTIDKNYGYTVGIHINMFETRVAVMNLHGEILAMQTISLEDIHLEAAQFIKELTLMVNEVVEKSGVKRDKILGVGIGTPGPVNTTEGMVLSPPNLKVFEYFPLKKVMEEQLKLPVHLHKDTNAIAMGEYWRGAGAGYQNMVYIDADMGIGSGLILDGELQPGSHYVAGEFGHMTLDVHGPLCNCGSKGCLEAIGSGIAILKKVRQELGQQQNAEHPLQNYGDRLTLHQVLQAGDAGDSLIIPILNNAAYNMGIAIGGFSNIFDPEVVIVGGMLVQNYGPYFAIMKDAALSKRLSGAQDNIIVPGECKEKAGVIGAGELVADYFFSTTVSELLSKN